MNTPATRSVQPIWKLFSRIYVPLATLLLVVLVGNHWGRESARRHLAELPRAADWTVGFQTSAGLPSGADVNRILYVGNSQITVIREGAPGDSPCYEALSTLLAREDPRVEVLPASLGGMSLSEALLTIAAHTQSVKPPRSVVLSVSIDMFRTLVIRSDVTTAIQNHGMQPAIEDWMRSNVDLPLAVGAIHESLQAGGHDAGMNQKGSDGPIDSLLNRLPLVHFREDMQREVVSHLVGWRNRLFRVRSSTVRPLTPEVYRTNVEILRLLMRFAESHNLHLFVYLAPLRPGEARPYLQADLQRLRMDLSSVCTKERVHCADYLDEVPLQFWGSYPDGPEGLGGQPDFGHLNAGGHAALANRVAHDLRLASGRDRGASR